MNREAPSVDRLADVLADAARARTGLDAIGPLMKQREDQIITLALKELRGSQLTPDRAFMHFAAVNGIRALRDELEFTVRRGEDAIRRRAVVDGLTPANEETE